MTDQPPLFAQHMVGLYAIDILAAGQVSGALAALADSPGTVEDVAARSGLDLRNVMLWLRAMTAAGHARHDSGVFTLNEETAGLLGPDFPVDIGAVLGFVHATFGEPFRASTRALRTGGGVPSEVFADLAHAAGSINTRTYQAALVDEWIAAAPGLADRLTAGGRIADLACGTADAAAVMAGAFPQSEVLGYDPGTPEDAHGDVPNLRIVRETAGRLPADGSFDLVTCLDAFHHLGDSRAAARQARDALRDGGVLLIAETALSGDVDTDSADPFSLITHAAGLFYCLQENLANGGDGRIPSDGLDWVDEALADAGFTSVSTHDSETGYRIFLAVR